MLEVAVKESSREVPRHGSESRVSAPAVARKAVRGRARDTPWQLFVKFFTESLILAQDERWRRA